MKTFTIRRLLKYTNVNAYRADFDIPYANNWFSARIRVSNFSWIVTGTNKMLTKQETAEIPCRFEYFIEEGTHYVTMTGIWYKSPILPFPLVEPKITEK